MLVKKLFFLYKWVEYDIIIPWGREKEKNHGL